MSYRLSADLRDLRVGLKRMKLPRKLKSKDTALIAFDGKFCSIEAFEQAIAMNARGTWPGIATFIRRGARHGAPVHRSGRARIRRWPH